MWQTGEVGWIKYCGGSLGRCGGSLVVLQTAEAVVPGSNPASLTVKKLEDRQSHCVYCKNLGAERETSPWGKKIVLIKIHGWIIKFYFLFLQTNWRHHRVQLWRQPEAGALPNLCREIRLGGSSRIHLQPRQSSSCRLCCGGVHLHHNSEMLCLVGAAILKQLATWYPRKDMSTAWRCSHLMSWKYNLTKSFISL